MQEEHRGLMYSQCSWAGALGADYYNTYVDVSILVFK